MSAHVGQDAAARVNRVLLVAPPIAQERVKLFPRHPPLLMAQLAAVLRAHGRQVSPLDAFALQLDVADAASRIASVRPDVVVLMPNDVARETPSRVTAALAERVRSVCPDVLLLGAGIGNAAFAGHLLGEARELAAVLLGDPEEALPPVLDALARGEDWRGLVGVMTRGTLDVAPAVVRELDELPRPAWDVVDLARYVVLPHRRSRGMEYPLLASRGCWWNRCLFCQDLACVKSGDYRVRSPAAVVEEMVAARQAFNARHFLFHDAVFPTREPWLRRFHAAVQGAGLGATWFCMARADAVSPEALGLMRESGCTNVCYGLESGSEEMLRRMQKGHGLEEAVRAVEWTRQAGMEVSATFILGFPGETAQDVRRTVEFACSLDIDYAQFLMVKWHSVPPADLGRGRLEEEWDLAQFDYRGMVFVPEAYGNLATLRLARSFAYLRFYLRPAYLRRTAARIRDLSDLARHADGARTLLAAVLNR